MHLEVCKFLVPYEAGNQYDFNGSNLETAVVSESLKKGCAGVVQVLTPFEALVQNPTSSEYPLHVAVRVGYPGDLDLLLGASRGQIL